MRRCAWIQRVDRTPQRVVEAIKTGVTALDRLPRSGERWAVELNLTYPTYLDARHTLQRRACSVRPLINPNRSQLSQVFESGCWLNLHPVKVAVDLLIEPVQSAAHRSIVGEPVGQLNTYPRGAWE
jgi:hypothetical protein